MLCTCRKYFIIDLFLSFIRWIWDRGIYQFSFPKTSFSCAVAVAMEMEWHISQDYHQVKMYKNPKKWMTITSFHLKIFIISISRVGCKNKEILFFVRLIRSFTSGQNGSLQSMSLQSKTCCLTYLNQTQTWIGNADVSAVSSARREKSCVITFYCSLCHFTWWIFNISIDYSSSLNTWNETVF